MMTCETWALKYDEGLGFGEEISSTVFCCFMFGLSEIGGYMRLEGHLQGRSI